MTLPMNNPRARAQIGRAIELSGAIPRPPCGEPPAPTGEPVRVGGSEGR
jgi:hypothetical protein